MAKKMNQPDVLEGLENDNKRLREQLSEAQTVSSIATLRASKIEKLYEESRPLIDRLKLELFQAKMELARLNGYIERVHSDDVANDEIVMMQQETRQDPPAAVPIRNLNSMSAPRPERAYRPAEGQNGEYYGGGFTDSMTSRNAQVQSKHFVNL